MAAASEKLPYQLYLCTPTHVFMQRENLIWQLPSDRQEHNDTVTRSRMVELLGRVSVPSQERAIYGAKVYVISNRGQKIRIVAVAADQRLLDGAVYMGGSFIDKTLIPHDDSVQLWTQQNVAALLEEQARERMAARVSDGFLPPLTGYRLVLTAGNETFPYILLDKAKDDIGEYLRLPGDDKQEAARGAMQELLSRYLDTTAIFTTHALLVGQRMLMFLVAHVDVMPVGNGDEDTRHCHVPRGKRFVPLTDDILQGSRFAQSTQLALKQLRDEAHAIDFKAPVGLKYSYKAP